MNSGVLRTRLLPPRLPPDCLARPELTQRLVDGMSGRLVTVLAGAGYGKSTAVAQALRACPRPSVWVSCDERLGGAPDLLAHIAAGIELVVPGFGARLAFEGQVAHQVAALCNELVATTPDDLVLVLDDVHLLDAEETEALAELLRDLPPSVHLVLAGRSPLGFALGKVRAGQLLAVTADDLALTAAEVAALWRSAGGAEDADTLRQVLERTEGWLTGVILAARAGDAGLKGGAEAGQLFAYLAEEVLTAQPRDIQDFILQTAVLERFSPQLASRLTGVADARALCRELVGGHLFAIRLEAEGEWYRYHHLFQSFLRDRVAELEPGLVPELHRRAAAAWLAEGQPTEAIDHLLAAGDLEEAAHLVESVADQMRLSPQARILARWIAALPQELYAGRPALTLARAFSTMSSGDFEGAFAFLERSLEDLLAAGEHDRAAEAFFGLIYVQLAGGTPQRFAIDVGYRQLPRIDHSAKLLPASMVLMASELGCATRYEEADRLLGEVLKLRLPRIDPLAQGYLASARALFMDHPRGHSKQALATIEWVIELFERNERYDELAFLPALHAYRTIILNQLGRYDDALEELDRMAATGIRRGISGGILRSVTKMRAVALAGLERWDELEVVLALGEPVDEMRGTSYGFRIRAPAARLAAHRGDTATVAYHAAVVMEYVDAFGFSFDTPGWVCDVAVAAWQVGLIDDARRLLGHVVDGAERAENPWARTRGKLLAAVVLDGDEADSALVEALELTERWEFDEIWTRRDRVMVPDPLVRAITAAVGPPGLAARLAVRAGGEVLDRCVEAISASSPAGSARLLEALDAAGIVDPQSRGRLAAATNGTKPRPPRGGGDRPARPPLLIKALGGFSVRRGDDAIPVSAFGRERARALLGALLCADGPVHRERLLDWLWPDLDVDRGLRALHVTLHALRRALEPELGRGSASRSVIRSEGEGYRLALSDGDTIDVAEFLALTQPVTDETHRQAVTRLLAAERAHGGILYPEWPYADWAAERRHEVEQAYSTVLAGLAEHLLAVGEHREALLRYERLVTLEPEREAFHRSLMATYARAGEKGLALRQYHACRAVLRRELGVEASPETRALYQLILEDQPVPEATAPVLA